MQLILASQSEGRKKLLSLLKIPFKIIPSALDEEKIIGKTPLETIQLRARRKGEEVAYSVIRDQLSEISNKKLTTDSRQLNTFLIISADSGAILGNLLIGKPKDYQDAVRILKTLSGKTHEFVTAVYMIESVKRKAQSEKLQLKTQNFEKDRTKPKIPILTTRVPCNNLQSTKKADTWPMGNKIYKLGEAEKKLGIEDLSVKTWQTYDYSMVTFRKLTDSDIKLYLSLSDYTKYAGGYTISATPQTFITKVDGSISNVIGLPLEKVIPKLKLLLS